MSRYTALFLTAVLALALIAAPAQALSSSDRATPSVYEQIESFVERLLGRLFGAESAPNEFNSAAANDKANDIIEPVGSD